MIRFANPTYVYLLLLLPVIAAGLIWLAKKRRKALAEFVSPVLLGVLSPELSSRKRWIKSTILLSSFAAILLALANPQIGTSVEDVKQEGVDIFIALDVSLSMKAEDVKPSRLEKAKYELAHLIDKLGGDRIGLIVFSGEAFVQFPLTTDYSAAAMFLDVVDVETVPNPGTAIGTAIAMALKSFNFEEPTTKVIIVITDGEDNEADGIARAEEAAQKGVMIYSLGMGSPSGSPIPLYDASGRQTDFKRDKAGNIVITKMDEGTLQRIAETGKGKYFRATNSQDEMSEIFKDINALQKREFGTKKFTDFEDQFQKFLFAALLLLIIETMISEKKIIWLERWNPFKQIGTNAEGT